MTTLFKQAHALTRATIQAGDNYQATFILCLRAIIADNKQANSEPMANQFNTIFEAIGYKPVRHRTYTCKPVSSIDRRLVADIIYAMTCLAIALFALWCAL